MLKLTSARKKSTKLKSGEIMQSIPLPDLSYRKLKADFAIASHLVAIEGLDLKGAGGVLIKCHNVADGHLAALYLYKKLEEDSVAAQAPTAAQNPAGDECFDEVEYFNEDESSMDCDDEDEIEDDKDTVESILYDENKLTHLPVIPANEFVGGFMKQFPPSMGYGFLNTRVESETKTREPYWMQGKYPLVVEDIDGYHLSSTAPFEHFEQTNRFLIYISSVQRQERGFDFTSHIDHLEKSILFETGTEFCVLEKAEIPYYEKVLTELVKAKGYKLSRSINKIKLIKELMDYRGFSFRSSVDIETFANKAINKKRDESKTLTKSDFTPLFTAREIHKKMATLGKSLDAASELDKLIGLADVKSQLQRLVKRMKFDKQRRNSGYKTSDTHASAVFMGSPGTAKTTVARIFGKMLCEANVLNCDTFLEVARKDLVGKFVGWTAPTVAKVFDEAKGGTIFIDEAYSLVSEGMSDGYSEEALSEIIRQMENNPDTLVIFAGYRDKMRHFIQNANPGLRSRLTNVIEFKDYEIEEMCEMFTYFLDKEEYILENRAAANDSIRRFVSDIALLQSENMGNGRLIRRLFKTAIGYMAERENNDLRTLKPSDIDRAAAEILNAELSVSRASDQKMKIGFY